MDAASRSFYAAYCCLY